jgi:hypothetical protein
MCQRLFVAVLFIGTLHAIANASGETTILFVDGRWTGGSEIGSDSKSIEECWVRTTFSDSTAFTLAKRSDGIWHLRLSNPDWRLPPSHQYDMVALVDFYPQLHIAGQATSPTSLEIANLDQISLLGIIENGHSIDLTSDGFNAKYDLEGSAKAIEKARHCFAD